MERGFQRVGGGVSYLRLQFFMLLVVFVVFDIEVVLVVGVCVLGMESVITILLLLGFVVGTLWME
jgi:NADH:ubiquinone oxidoreductase subunit 3 (subunit A)